MVENYEYFREMCNLADYNMMKHLVDDTKDDPKIGKRKKKENDNINNKDEEKEIIVQKKKINQNETKRINKLNNFKKINEEKDNKPQKKQNINEGKKTK